MEDVDNKLLVEVYTRDKLKKNIKSIEVIYFRDEFKVGMFPNNILITMLMNGHRKGAACKTYLMNIRPCHIRNFRIRVISIIIRYLLVA